MKATPQHRSSQRLFWAYEFYGMPLWMIIILVILGVAFPVFGGAARRGGGRSGGGGSTGRW